MKKIIFVLATAASFGLAHAQERYDRRHEPYRTPHWVYDDRYRHGHYYPAVGYAVDVLPAGYLSIRYGSRHMFFHGGVWFEPAGPRYVVVRPPVGVVVPVLPPASTTVWIGGTPYYYANDVYYMQAQSGYAVAAPPPEVATTTPPPGPQPPGPAAPPAAAPQGSGGNWYYCVSAKAYYPYVQQCSEGWHPVPATPQPPR